MSPCSILVVDDEDSLREIVTEVLNEEGYAVRAAPDGARALEVVEQHLPDVVLLDMRMPVLNGWEFARELRARHNRAAKIVVMTAATDAERWAREIEAEAYLAKPFDLDALLETVGQFCAGGA